MINFNQVILTGRLVRNPELKYTPNGIPVCNFSLAVNDKSNTYFFECEAWRKVAELIAGYLKKGSKVLLGGKLTSAVWSNNSGQKRKATRIIVNQIMFLNTPKNNENEKKTTTEKAKEIFGGVEEYFESDNEEIY